MCRDYLCSENAEFTIEITKADIIEESRLTSQLFSEAYLESTAVLRKFAKELSKRNGCVMHGAVIAVNEKGIIFTAPSGTGKTTHICNWKSIYKNNVTVVNGDKPVLRVINNRVYAYGTPWAGKENMNCNTKVELKAVCFLNRGTANALAPIDYSSGAKRLLKQIYLGETTGELDNCINIVNHCSKGVKLFEMHCTKETDSALQIHNALERYINEN